MTETSGIGCHPNLARRAVFGAALTIAEHGGSQILRLVSNLILTRILFPDAFGLMALVQVFLNGLIMFSDLGIRTAIVQSRQGDDPAFLDTAWTIQILRGTMLWLMACALARPAAAIYAYQSLEWLLPVAALQLVIEGFLPTRVSTAGRHLRLGRLTLIELGAQTIGIVAMIALSLVFHSVWALVFGGLVGALLRLLLCNWLLQGRRDHLRWDRNASQELLHFGKYLFFSSVAAFLSNQGDRALLGKFASLSDLAVYQIGFYLAVVPLTLCRKLSQRILLPVYRESHPYNDPKNRLRLHRSRLLLTGGTFALAATLILGGDALVRFLYDSRYHDAGPILILLGLSFLPELTATNYARLFLARGDSRRFCVLAILSASVRIVAVWLGLQFFGLPGMIAAPAISQLAVYPFLIGCLHKHHGWDPRHDLTFLVIGLALGALTVWINASTLAAFISN